MLRLVLLLLALAASASSETVSVACPELSPADSICADAREGFDFMDGCNRIRCLPGGGAASTRRQCPPPGSDNQRSLCRSLAFSVFDRLPSRQCPNAAAEAVCSRARGRNTESGFRFTDGCNMIACSADGSVAGVTRRSCQHGRPDSAYCQFVESLNTEAAEADGSSMQRRRRSEQQQEFACPQLAISEVCGRATNGLSYSDGCNSITCHADGTGQSTFKVCPSPDGSAAATAYCEAAAQAVEAKKQRASLRNRCLQPSEVCVGDAVRRRLGFNDGCNRCFCVGQGEASCTRRYCPRVLMTDQEFENYCEQRGAGRH